MSKDNNENSSALAAASRPALRLIRSDEANTQAVEAEASETLIPRPKSRLGQFMTAFADAVDRDVQLILEL